MYLPLVHTLVHWTSGKVPDVFRQLFQAWCIVWVCGIMVYSHHWRGGGHGGEATCAYTSSPHPGATCCRLWFLPLHGLLLLHWHTKLGTVVVLRGGMLNRTHGPKKQPKPQTQYSSRCPKVLFSCSLSVHLLRRISTYLTVVSKCIQGIWPKFYFALSVVAQKQIYS